MVKLIAAEWDDRELRMVSVTTTGRTFVVDRILASSFRPQSVDRDAVDTLGATSSMVAPSDSEITSVLRKLSSQADAVGSDVFLNVPRSKVELRNFSLPQASVDDLPDMVRFAAMRQFANLGDAWPIDFLVLPKGQLATGSEGESANAIASNGIVEGNITEVLATAVAPSFVASMRRVCSDAGLNLVHLGLRPVSTSCLAIDPVKQIIAPEETVLVIDIAPDEAELVVMEGHQIVFIRTVRLVASTDGTLPKLPAAEVKRTLIAAMNSRSGISVKRIILWGSHVEMNSMVFEWSGAVSLPIECIDPFSIIPNKSPVDTKLEGSLARFAPLLGLLLQRQVGAPPIKLLGVTVREATPQVTPWSSLTINFLSPRQRTIPPRPIRQYILAGIATGLLLVGGAGWYRSTHAALDTEVSDLLRQVAAQNDPMKLAQKNTNEWQRISRFLEGDIQWLDQLEYLSSNSLLPVQMLMGDTVFSIDPVANRGIVGTRVALSSQELEPVLESKLRDAIHQVGAKGVNRSSDKNTIYPWIVEPEIIVSAREDIDPQTWKSSQPPAAKPPEVNSSKSVNPEVTK